MKLLDRLRSLITNRFVQTGLFVATLLGVAMGASFFVDFRDYLSDLRTWLADFGIWAPAVFVALYCVWTLAGLPGMVLTVVAALSFGTLEGILVMIISSTLAAILGFLIARYAIRDRLLNSFGKNKRFKQVQHAVEENGMLVVTAIRVAPFFPFSMVNYSLGLTAIGFWTFVLYSEAVMIPLNIVYVIASDAIATAFVRGEIPWGPFALGVAVAVFLAGIIYVVQKRVDLPANAAG